MQYRIISYILASSMIIATLGGMAGSAAHPEPATADGLVAQLLRVGGADAIDADNVAMLDRLLQPQTTLTFASPEALVERIHEVDATMGRAETPQDVLIEAAALRGVHVDRLVPAASTIGAAGEILAIYGTLGLAATPLEILGMKQDITRMPAAEQVGLGILLHAVNQALALEALGTETGDMQAALLLLDSADVASPMMSSASMACEIFEDPQKLVYIGSPCDDVVVGPEARILQYDPAGNDQYFTNSGGARSLGAIANQLVQAGVISDRTILEVLSNVTLEPIAPLVPTILDAEDYAFNVLDNPDNATADESFLNRTLNHPDLIGNLTSIIENMTAGATNITYNELAFIQEFVDGVHLILEIDEENARTWVPIALHIDDAGDDRYYSLEGMAQGATDAGIGIAIDRAGNDRYECVLANCQGAALAGIGLLADMDGEDLYIATISSQASGSGAFLIDMGEDNDRYLSMTTSQGAVQSALVPSTVPSMLLDDGGDDHYRSNSLSQGAGNFLIDLGGADHYLLLTDVGQGVGAAVSDGLLLDRSGDDVYRGRMNVQGACVVQGRGVLADLGGNDRYVAMRGQGVATSSGCFAMLLDEDGDDVYRGDFESQGYSMAGAVGALIDRQGNDRYIAGILSQGATDDALIGGFLGLLVDGGGDDYYMADDRSQGLGVFYGAGILVDNGGRDVYSSGAFSQGSGYEEGLGILIDGAGDGANEIAQMAPLSTPGGDLYTAGNFSQGSSGEYGLTGGVGMLIDEHDVEGLRGVFVAGSHSQGSAAGGGVGILFNGNGDDVYRATADSQGSSIGGVGLLVDRLGVDLYDADVASSQGYASGADSVGVLADLSGEDDRYEDMKDYNCRIGGEHGLAIDTELPYLPVTCQQAVGVLAVALADGLIAEVAGTVDSALAAILGGNATAPPPSPYFHDDMEAGGDNWNATAGGLGLTAWHLVNASKEPQIAPNARSGQQYWFVGLPVSGTGYASDAAAKLTSIPINLAGAASPQLSAWVGGSSEEGFDFLNVNIIDDTAGSVTTLASFSGGLPGLEPYQEALLDLSAFVNHTIRIQFEFTSDGNAEPGQGWNVDDVTVAEA